MLDSFENKISNPASFKNPKGEGDPYFRSLLLKYERIPTRIYNSALEGCRAVASEIADTIRAKDQEGKACVLGISVYGAPREVYSELIRLHKKEGLSFSKTVIFGIMEYYPLKPEAAQSFSRIINEKFISHLDIPEDNVFLLDGTLPQDRVVPFCRHLENRIKEAGGIDMHILGIGGTGRIGFNEPGTARNSVTRLVSLDDFTRTEAASDFFGKENVPRKALTQGIQTICGAKKVRLLAWGEDKAQIIKKAVEGKPTEEVPASFLQEHGDAVVVLDMAAAAELTRISTPWLVDQVIWTNRLIRKAVVWLSRKVDKPVLKLTDRDYSDHGMDTLITEKGVAYNINIQVFNDLQHTITGWPGGKPEEDDTNRPERKAPFPKRVIIFSPHPDDDVISMGGTMLRLVEHGHDVHVAYQTSGNIAVSDSDALRYMDFIRGFREQVEKEEIGPLNSMYREICDFIEDKDHDTVDLDTIRKIKTLIRVGEAKASCRYAGVKTEHVHFLNLPFYETGGVEKRPVAPEDVGLVVDLIRKVKPHQIYAAGDLSDPHGTHRVCLNIIFDALDVLRGDDWIKDCWVWLYRGAWQEWDIHQIEMAVPISPDELMRKRMAIFKHQSQKDGAVFMGEDNREFWQRAEERNRGTAKAYDDLGLAEYEAVEAFVRYNF